MDASDTLTAACARCGVVRVGFANLCPSCGTVVDADGRLVAWLLSGHNLDAAGVIAVGLRIRAGEAVVPTERSLDKARRALGRHLATDPGLSRWEGVAILFTSLLLTMLPGVVAAWWWRDTRPRAARMALALAVPSGFLVAVLWGVFVWAA